MDFEIIGEIRQPETFARGSGIKELPRLHKFMVLATGVSAKATPRCVCPMGLSVKQKFIGTRLRELANVNSRLSVMLAFMNHTYLLAPHDYERMFRTIHWHLRNHFANPHKCCTFFSVIGASILNVAHNIKGISFSGAAAFEYGLAKPIFLADGKSNFFTHSANGFHSWIEADGWLIDLTSPLLPEYANEANLGVPPRRMLQKPLTEEAPSAFELSQERPFYLSADREFTTERVDFVLENPIFLKIVHDCITSYCSRKVTALSDIRIEGAW